MVDQIQIDILKEFYNKIKNEQIELDSDIVKMVNDNFWDLS